MVAKSLKIVMPVALTLGALIGLKRARSPDEGNLAMLTCCVGLVALAIEIVLAL